MSRYDTLQTDYSLSYTEWLQQACAEYPNYQKHLRFGQFFCNVMPNRLVGKIPFAFDPFYDDTKVELFLEWLKRNWR